MTLMRPESAVLSQLLCDLPDAPPEVSEQIGAGLIRALGLSQPEPDFSYAESLRLGFTESLDDYAARMTNGGA